MKTYKKKSRLEAIAPRFLFHLGRKRVCLVTGAPRSGTSALCRWLGEQPRVAVYPESRLLLAHHRFLEEANRFRRLKEKEPDLLQQARRQFFDFYAAQSALLGSGLIVQKEPLEPIAFPDKRYEAFLINARKLFPEMPLIFMLRDPVDSIWSMSQRKWGFSLTQADPQSLPLDVHIETWCACANLIRKSAKGPNVYICSFERLIKEPAEESQRIANFLENRLQVPFQPRPTRMPDFNEETRSYIEQRVEAHLEAISHLM